MTGWLRAITVVAAFQVCASPARADSRPWAAGVSEPAQKTALDLFKRGNELFAKKSYAEALKLYREALTSWDHPGIRFNISECLISLDQPLEAYDNLIAALRFGEPALGAEDFERATRTKLLLEGQLAHLDVRCDEPGAIVTLDGKRLFVAPGQATRTVMPGPHQIVASKPGYITFTREDVLVSRKTQQVELRLARMRTFEYRWKRWKPWAVVGGGVAIALAGVGFRSAGQSSFDEFHAELAVRCPQGCVRSSLPAGTVSIEDRGRRMNGLAGTSYAIGGAAIVTGLVLVLLNQERAVESPLPDRAAIRIGGTTWSLAWQF